jgi:hypothetical protein
MDTSKEYIKMCERSVEIQVLKEIERDGDFYWVEAKYDHGIKTICHDEFEGYAQKSNLWSVNDDRVGHETKRLVWLPRQDQLQEILGENWKDNLLLICHWMEWKSPLGLHSMEQLWLSFVMRQKFNKAWNGEDWISR